MPQLDFSTFFSQAFWLVVSFLLMWLIMARLIIPRITEMPERRQRKIDDYLEAADKFKRSAEDALEKYEQALARANALAAETTQKAYAELENKIAEKERENNLRLEEMLAANERKIEENRRQVMEQMEKAAAGIALRMAEKLNLENIVSAEDMLPPDEGSQKNE